MTAAVIVFKLCLWQRQCVHNITTRRSCKLLASARNNSLSVRIVWKRSFFPWFFFKINCTEIKQFLIHYDNLIDTYSRWSSFYYLWPWCDIMIDLWTKWLQTTMDVNYFCTIQLVMNAWQQNRNDKWRKVQSRYLLLVFVSTAVLVFGPPRDSWP
jgi:hypothetical protein